MVPRVFVCKENVKSSLGAWSVITAYEFRNSCGFDPHLGNDIFLIQLQTSYRAFHTALTVFKKYFICLQI